MHNLHCTFTLDDKGNSNQKKNKDNINFHELELIASDARWKALISSLRASKCVVVQSTDSTTFYFQDAHLCLCSKPDLLYSIICGKGIIRMLQLTIYH